MDEIKKEYPSASEAFKWLSESPVGDAWRDIKCVCRQLWKDDACSLNCKEFYDESLPNRKSESK